MNLDTHLQEVYKKYKNNPQLENGYTYASYINRVLRENVTLESQYEDEIRLLDRLTDVYATKKDLTVYRTCCDYTFENYIDNNDVFTYPMFMSVSIYKEYVAKKFSEQDCKNCLLEITLPKETKLAPLEGQPGETKEEQELLLPRNTKFKVISKDRISEDEVEILIGKSPFKIEFSYFFKLQKIK
ncbi:MAG: hypothetical protein JJ953_09875 [Gracilimonas sp.]|uniref:ADP-ribosyltransferase n=1 Tax=Gracilimonas TaxID=649462 RepID=UPI001B16EF80|nr:ADP-ribosyltransferase [Gracilimonas sp.]MBO6586400.1 hypothetical protein [Gracilimonas sp.]MBO6615057.1 hypothetical protein [Gracilimonas sp.]